MEETFYYTNIVPQDINNNGGFWNRLEIYCRDLTNNFTDVRVISGPLMLQNTEEGSKRFVKYEVSRYIAMKTACQRFSVMLYKANVLYEHCDTFIN